MTTVSADVRRLRLIRRHRLDGSAASVEEAVGSVVVLHATDPATVFLSVLARCRRASLSDVSAALHERRTLVRMMAMRRTVFVAPVQTAPVVHAAASLGVAATMRRRLLQQLQSSEVEPPVLDDLDTWLAAVEAGAEESVRTRGVATAAEIVADESRLATALLPRSNKPYDVRRSITSQVLVLLGAQGRIVRGEPQGGWTSRRHRWEPAERWWPTGMPAWQEPSARTELLRRWLAAFGPATETDAAWWTGWNLGQTRQALKGLDLRTVDLDGTEGFLLAEDDFDEPPPTSEPSVALLPALDPTPMGWKQRQWFLGVESKAIFDSYGNIGPTVWWNGEIVGGWAVRPGGSICWRLLADRGAAVGRATAAAAATLEPKLAGATVVPSFRTPLERELCAG